VCGRECVIVTTVVKMMWGEQGPPSLQGPRVQEVDPNSADYHSYRPRGSEPRVTEPDDEQPGVLPFTTTASSTPSVVCSSGGRFGFQIVEVMNRDDSSCMLLACFH
jgi:hypothetical protein